MRSTACLRPSLSHSLRAFSGSRVTTARMRLCESLDNSRKAGSTRLRAISPKPTTAHPIIIPPSGFIEPTQSESIACSNQSTPHEQWNQQNQNNSSCQPCTNYFGVSTRKCKINTNFNANNGNQVGVCQPPISAVSCSASDGPHAPG